VRDGGELDGELPSRARARAWAAARRARCGAFEIQIFHFTHSRVQDGMV